MTFAFLDTKVTSWRCNEFSLMLIGNFGKYALGLAAVLRLAARAAYQPRAREHHRKQLVARPAARLFVLWHIYTLSGSKNGCMGI